MLKERGVKNVRALIGGWNNWVAEQGRGRKVAQAFRPASDGADGGPEGPPYFASSLISRY